MVTPSYAWRLGLHAMDLDASGHDTFGAAGLPIFQFEDYGAVGDGTTDDAVALQDTIDAIDSAGGGILLVGPKTYATSATLNFAGPTYRVMGTGTRYGPSTIKMLTNNTTLLSFVTTSLSGFRIETSIVENLRLLGPHTTAAQATSGRGVYATSDVFCHEVMASGFFEGFRWQGTSYYSYARDCFATNCAEAGYVFDGCNNSILDNCRAIGQYSSTLPLGAMKYGAKIIGGSGSISIGMRVFGGSYEYFSRDGILIEGGGPVWIGGSPYFETQQSSSGYAHIAAGRTTEVKALYIESAYLQGDGTAGFDGIALDRVNTFWLGGLRFGINGAIGVSSTANTSGGTRFKFYNSPTGTISLPADTIDLSTQPMTNPMTTAGDIIKGGSSGVAQRLAIGTSGYVLRVVTGAPAWSADDQINGVTVSGTPSAGQHIVATSSSAAAWTTPATSSGGDHEHMVDGFTGDGSTTAFELTDEPVDPEMVVAFVNGSETAVSISGGMSTTATFGAAPGAGQRVTVMYPAVAA